VRSAFWKSDRFIGLIVVLLCYLFSGTQSLQQFDNAAYDLGVKFSSSRLANPNVVVVAIDDASLDELGAWPWPRDILADIVKRISQARPAVIGLALPFDKKQSSSGLEYIQQLKTLFDQDKRSYNRSARRLLDRAENNLDTDNLLVNAFRNAGRVVLALPYQLSENDKHKGRPPVLNRYLKRYELKKVSGIPEEAGWFSSLWKDSPVPLADVIYPPIKELSRFVGAIGHVELGVGDVSTFRSEPLVLQYGDHYLPSFSLMLAIRNSNKSTRDIKVDLENGVKMGGEKIATDEQLRVYPRFYQGKDGASAFKEISASQVYNNQIMSKDLRNKIVIVGITTRQHTKILPTALGNPMAPALVSAHTVSSLLNGEQYHFLEDTKLIQLLCYLLVALYLIVLLPKLRITTGLVVSILLLIGFINAHFITMIASAIWLPLMIPAFALVVGHFLIGFKHLFEQSFSGVKQELSEANLSLGKSFHEQGQLDQAYEKYRKCLMTPDTLHNLYNLGLDYERKRQLNKAASVFKFIEGFDANYSDIQERIGRNKEVSDAMAFGGSAKKNQNMNGTLILSSPGIQKPTIGRYSIDEELGRGAMGMVYLGHDPKIGRTVAIKTMMLSQEFEDDKLDDVKRRFFREAETAGRLDHPNIVTIYDVGEDQDLSYIAMDYIKGKALSEYCKPENLLPADEVFDIVAKVTEGLDYAMGKNVVHRDIKPANIIYDRDTRSVKITDFGVACLTDASKTKTGTILGSPSYMSPEQLAGKKVDGRSDLFSLGITFYQLLTGELPFIGESMASLMYKIANEKHPDIRMFRPDLPACTSTIMNKALHKDLEKRFQTGERMASALERCRERIGKKRSSKKA